MCLIKLLLLCNRANIYMTKGGHENEEKTRKETGQKGTQKFLHDL